MAWIYRCRQCDQVVDPDQLPDPTTQAGPVAPCGHDAGYYGVHAPDPPED